MSDDQLQELRNRAEAYSDLGRPEQAIPLLHQALNLDPQNSDLLCRIASAYLDVKDVKRGLEYADRAVQADPEDEWCHRMRSIVLWMLGYNEKAVQAAQEAVRLEPENPLALAVLSRFLIGCDRRDAAERIALQILEVAPEYDGGYILLAEIQTYWQRWPKVEGYARQALALDAEGMSALMLLGEALVQMSRPSKAIPCFVSVIRQSPDNEKARDRLFGLLPRFPIWLPLILPVPFLIPFLLLRWARWDFIPACLLSTIALVVLTMIVFCVYPLLLVLPNPTFRLLSSSFRDYYLRERKRHWLSDYREFVFYSLRFFGGVFVLLCVTALALFLVHFALLPLHIKLLPL